MSQDQSQNQNDQAQQKDSFPQDESVTVVKDPFNMENILKKQNEWMNNETFLKIDQQLINNAKRERRITQDVGELQALVERFKIRKCTNCCWCFVYLVLMALAVIIFLSTKFSFDATNFDLLSAQSDKLWNVCGYTAEDSDPRAPFISNVADNKTYTFEFCHLLSKSADNPQGMTDLCNKIPLVQDEKYNMTVMYSIAQILQTLRPMPGSVAYETQNGHFCIQPQPVINESNLCQLDASLNGGSICGVEFSVAALQLAKDDPTGYSQLSSLIAVNQQLFAAQQFSSIKQVFDAQANIETAKNFSFLMNLCGELGNDTYEHKSFQHYQRCDIDQSNKLQRILGNMIKFPAYIEYLVNYVTNFRTHFLQEIGETWSSVLVSIAVSTILSYVAISIILGMTKVTFIFASMMIPAVFGGIGGVLIWVALNSQESDDFKSNAFGYRPGGSVQWLLWLVIALLFLLSLCLFAMNFLDLKTKLNKADNVGLCKDVLRRRFRMCLYPIMFIIFTIIHTAACVVMILVLILNGQFDAQYNMISFKKMEKQEWELNGTNVASIAFLVVFLILGLIFLYACLQYETSALTTLWYEQRISSNSENERTGRLQKEQGNLNEQKQGKHQSYRMRIKATRFEKERNRAAKRKTVVQNGLIHGEIGQEYFDIGLGNAYAQGLSQLIKALGSLVLHAVVFVLCIFLKVLLFGASIFLTLTKEVVMNQISDSTMDKVERVIRQLLMLASRKQLIFMQIIGCKFGDAMNFDKAFGVNKRFTDDLNKVTTMLTIVLKIVVAVAAVIIEQLTEAYIFKRDLWQFQLTPIIFTILISLYVSGMVLNLISTVNQSFLMKLNVEQKMQISQNKYVLPPHLNKAAKRYSILEPDQRFYYKESIQCLVKQSDE